MSELTNTINADHDVPQSVRRRTNLTSLYSIRGWSDPIDILPALKDGDSHNWRHMSVPGEDI